VDPTFEELTRRALALSIPERIELAMTLWDSIPEAEHVMFADDEATIAEAHRRAAEMEADPSIGRTHEEVFGALRRSLRLHDK
jgi:putative addiction module component (TIGR02574 family)